MADLNFSPFIQTVNREELIKFLATYLIRGELLQIKLNRTIIEGSPYNGNDYFFMLALVFQINRCFIPENMARKVEVPTQKGSPNIHISFNERDLTWLGVLSVLLEDYVWN